MAQRSPEIVADVFEQASGIPGRLESLGATVRSARLSIGDYDVGAGTLIERKSRTDLLMSLRTGRLWSQLRRLREESSFPVLIIEGTRWNPASAAATRGLLLAVADQGIVVFLSHDVADTALWVRDLARRRSTRVPRDRPPYAHRPRNPRVHPSEAVLASIKGISVQGSRALLAQFGSVRGVVQAEPQEWLTVRGIGPARASEMEVALHDLRPS